jgi:hypothetical protein
MKAGPKTARQNINGVLEEIHAALERHRPEPPHPHPLPCGERELS